MAITQALCTSFKEEVLNGVHALDTTVSRADTSADTFKMALYESSADLGATTTVYTTSGEVSGSGYSAGGMELTAKTPDSEETTAFASFEDPTWTSATFSAAGALIYNASQGNKAVAVLSFGGTYATSGGNFTVELPDNTREQALIRIS